MSEAAEAVRTVELVKAFEAGRLALAGVDLTVPRGDFLAVMGPSGCGKSTLLHLIAGLDRPTSGKVFVNGRDLEAEPDLDRFRRREVGLVFQLHNLLPNFSAAQNVAVALFSTGMSHRAQRQRALECLDAVSLSDKADVPPPRLSGGERQRLAIARALANAPPILLADEPTGNLDAASVDQLLDLLRRIRREQGVTILLVTHDAHVSSAADRIVRMLDGRIVEERAATSE
jgi:putative ABC transport system ATP-binding protein